MSTQSVDDLAAAMRPQLAAAVDTLHVAALLESSGITDEVARLRFDHEDVFALARTMRTAVSGTTEDEVPLNAQHRLAAGPPLDPHGATSVTHGVIYLLPALSIPALLQVVSPLEAIWALVIGSAVGWLWALLATWWAYQQAYGETQHVADAAVRLALVPGLGLGVVAGSLTVAFGLLPPLGGLAATTVTTMQLGTTLLFFLRRRRLLLVLMGVPAAFGLAHLLAPALVPAWLVLAVMLLASLIMLAAGRLGEGARLQRVPLTGAGAVLGYAVASVAFLLLPQVVFLVEGGGLPVALAGLFVTMGVVEWRSGVLSHTLRWTLALTGSPAQFGHRLGALVARETAVCVVATGLADVALLLLLDRLGLASPAVILVVVSTSVLAAAYMVGLVLANAGDHRWLAGSYTAATLVELGVWGSDLAPMSSAFVVAVGVLFILLLIGVLTRPVQHYR